MYTILSLNVFKSPEYAASESKISIRYELNKLSVHWNVIIHWTVDKLENSKHVTTAAYTPQFLNIS